MSASHRSLRSPCFERVGRVAFADTIGVLIIRTWFCNIVRNPQNSIGNYLGPYSTLRLKTATLGLQTQKLELHTPRIEEFQVLSLVQVLRTLVVNSKQTHPTVGGAPPNDHARPRLFRQKTPQLSGFWALRLYGVLGYFRGLPLRVYGVRFQRAIWAI